jgi:hypothetical protein
VAYGCYRRLPDIDPEKHKVVGKIYAVSGWKLPIPNHQPLIGCKGDLNYITAADPIQAEGTQI